MVLRPSRRLEALGGVLALQYHVRCLAVRSDQSRSASHREQSKHELGVGDGEREDAKGRESRFHRRARARVWRKRKVGACDDSGRWG